MRLTKDNMMFAALLITETAWIFGITNALATAGNLGGAPLNFFAIFGIMLISLMAHRFVRQRFADSIENAFVVVTLGGIVMLYLLIAAHIQSGQLDLAWITKLGTFGLPENYAFKGIAGFIFGVLLWFRGLMLASAASPEKSLPVSFRFGILFLGIATIMDIMLDAQLNTFLMVFIFFATGLAGLNISNLVPETQESADQKTWPKVIVGAVAGILMVGVVFGALQQGVFITLTAPVRWVFITIAKGIAFVLVIPLAFLFEQFSRGVETFFGDEDFAGQDFGQSGLGGEDDELGNLLENITSTVSAENIGGAPDEGSAELVDLIFRVILVLLVGFVVLSILMVFFLYIKKTAIRDKGSKEGHRESVRDEGDLANDLKSLFRNLLPNFGNILKRNVRVWGVPDSQAGVQQALQLYYGMLTTAEEKGVPRPHHSTPSEFRSSLGQLYPRDIVDPATEVFNKANYGDIPPEDADLARLKSALSSSKAGVANVKTQVVRTSGLEETQSPRKGVPPDPLNDAKKPPPDSK